MYFSPSSIKDNTVINPPLAQPTQPCVFKYTSLQSLPSILYHTAPVPLSVYVGRVFFSRHETTAHRRRVGVMNVRPFASVSLAVSQPLKFRPPPPSYNQVDLMPPCFRGETHPGMLNKRWPLLSHTKGSDDRRVPFLFSSGFLTSSRLSQTSLFYPLSRLDALP